MAIVDDTRWREAMRELDELMESLSLGDADQARDIWRRHLINTGNAVRRAQFSEENSEAQG